MRTEAFRVYCRDEIDQNVNLFQVQKQVDNPKGGTTEQWVCIIYDFKVLLDTGGIFLVQPRVVSQFLGAAYTLGVDLLVYWQCSSGGAWARYPHKKGAKNGPAFVLHLVHQWMKDRVAQHCEPLLELPKGG